MRVSDRNFFLGLYGSLVKVPVIGPVARYPVRALRYALRPTIQAEVGRQLNGGAAQHAEYPVAAGLWDATANLQSQVQALWHRLEFVRAETMFEMRAMMDGGRREIGYRASAETRIKDKTKVEAAIAAGNLRLNVGCGHVPLDGFVNVDGRDLPGVDVVADATAIPFDPGSVREIHSSHLLEHVPVEHFRRVLLPHWKSLLAAGGVLRSVVPDAEGMIADYVAGTMSFDDLREVTYGLQEYEGDFHFNMFSRDMLKAMISEAGFEDVEYAFVNRKNGKCRDMEIRGRKP
jgi:predicted SAM-dependent methyltransferase